MWEKLNNETSRDLKISSHTLICSVQPKKGCHILKDGWTILFFELTSKPQRTKKSDMKDSKNNQFNVTFSNTKIIDDEFIKKSILILGEY